MNTTCLIAPHFAGLLHLNPADSAATRNGAEKFQGQKFDFSGGSLTTSSAESVLVDSDLIVVADLRLHNGPETRSRLGISANEGTPAQLMLYTL